MMRLPLWPRSLANRTALVLTSVLVIVQLAGLAIHALDRIDLQQLAQARYAGSRISLIYRSVMSVPPEERQALIQRMDLPPGYRLALSQSPPLGDTQPIPQTWMQLLRAGMSFGPPMQEVHPVSIIVRLDRPQRMLQVSLQMPSVKDEMDSKMHEHLSSESEGRSLSWHPLVGKAGKQWLTLYIPLPPVEPWHSPTFLAAFILMTLTAACLSIWATRRLIAPVRTLSHAAEALGRDVNAPPLEEKGPREIVQAAQIFNVMAARIRRFVQDRTFILSAIGHDLRTPITRLKLRAEFIDDEELRRRMIADLDELEEMVSATLAFGRDADMQEPMVLLDLPELAKTILDEVADARPDYTERLHYIGPDHLPVRGRTLPLKRAITNLLNNALAYGGSATIRISLSVNGMVRMDIEDEGPGIPPEDMERVFDPYQRLEGSRSRETGGFGLGLPIARNILRAHGGDVVLSNRREGGACASVTLPA
ncbi:Two component system histidine kinase [Granulibacter bethesdensis]|uniref:histidine kinase n=1 Tax=Granulibacter bethesdensis TaxID=364410 RepID=A0AAN0RD13_9PROT|nr:ATP-binding protein [Granulibacter bethesdensis]AHJ62557.1 Two component system histidine kinase [Granulibacter bethesdensis]